MLNTFLVIVKLFKGTAEFPLPADMRERCHGASCMQANDAEGRKNDRLSKEREGKGI